MQMIMFFVDSDTAGSAHITRTTKRSRRPGLDIDRPVPRNAEVLVLDQRTDCLALPKRLVELDRMPQPAPPPVVVDEEETERWDGLY